MIRRGRKYWAWVKEQKAALQGDGCTKSPDFFYTHCCDQHDIHYRTGRDEDGNPISRWKADKLLFKCMRKTGKTAIMGRIILPTLYWAMVRLFGGGAWKGS